MGDNSLDETLARTYPPKIQKTIPWGFPSEGWIDSSGILWPLGNHFQTKKKETPANTRQFHRLQGWQPNNVAFLDVFQPTRGFLEEAWSDSQRFPMDKGQLTRGCGSSSRRHKRGVINFQPNWVWQTSELPMKEYNATRGVWWKILHPNVGFRAKFRKVPHRNTRRW